MQNLHLHNLQSICVCLYSTVVFCMQGKLKSFFCINAQCKICKCVNLGIIKNNLLLNVIKTYAFRVKYFTFFAYFVLKFLCLRAVANHVSVALKKKYIPLCAAGKISTAEAARKIGITDRSVRRLKARYNACGCSVFIHGNTGKKHAKKYDYSKISADYKKFSGSSFGAFRDNCEDFLGYSPSYTTVYNILSAAGVVSPRARLPVRKKKKHLPRKERPCEGDLVQVDGSSHDWLMNNTKTCIHGGIDDATHKITALYMCLNECKLGYFEMLRQTYERFGGFPRALYSDRSSCFFTVKNSLQKCTIEEQLKGMREKNTEWQAMASALEIELIAALSPQAKGRIERLWQTLQGRLPGIFRYLGIKTISAANAFLKNFVDSFNARFAVPAQDSAKHWQESPAGVDLDFLLSVKTERKTRADGSFIYHGYNFGLVASRAACVPLTLCLNERYGLRAVVAGRYYPVELREPLCDVVGDSMPYVEKELIRDYLMSDKHDNRAVV